MKKKISVIGIGKLGLCFALNAEKAGFKVLGLDTNRKYLEKIRKKKLNSKERYVNNYLKKSKNLAISNKLTDAINFSDFIFIFVATPSKKNGEYNHSSINKIFNSLKKIETKKIKNIIVGCTVMPGYLSKMEKIMKKFNYSISYNPEFIAQGTIIKDQQNPEIVLLGTNSVKIVNFIKFLNKKIVSNKPCYAIMSLIEAEITKLALNCFLTNKIAFANMIGDAVSKSKGDPKKVLKAIGSDSRVGNKYFKYGYGFGGPCFPRDNRAFQEYAKKIRVYSDLSKATDISNRKHLEFQTNELLKKKIKKIKFTKITYKPESMMIEKSQKLELANKIAKKIKVTIAERKEVINQLKKRYKNLFSYQTI